MAGCVAVNAADRSEIRMSTPPGLLRAAAHHLLSNTHWELLDTTHTLWSTVNVPDFKPSCQSTLRRQPVGVICPCAVQGVVMRQRCNLRSYTGRCCNDMALSACKGWQLQGSTPGHA